MLDLLQQPWPWYVAGPLIGLTVPALLLVGNKALGISSSLRHICAACVPAGVLFLTYNWRAESWNLVFVLGIALGGFIGYRVLGHPTVIGISPEMVRDLQAEMHLTDFTGLLPKELFALDNTEGALQKTVSKTRPKNLRFQPARALSRSLQKTVLFWRATKL